MRKSVLLTLAVLAVSAVLGTAQAIAQQTDPFAEPAPSQVSYAFDPVHAGMTATPPASFVIAGKLDPDPAATPASTTYTGTVQVLYTVKLISTLPKGAVVRCGANVGLEYQVQEQVTGIAILGTIGILSSTESVDASVSNGTATCRMTLPYSWTVPSSTAKTTIVVRGVMGSIGISVTMAEAFGDVNRVVTLRSTLTPLVGPALPPADGGTINLRANAVL